MLSKYNQENISLVHAEAPGYIMDFVLCVGLEFEMQHMQNNITWLRIILQTTQ
jgi:hypothetical protein